LKVEKIIGIQFKGYSENILEGGLQKKFSKANANES